MLRNILTHTMMKLTLMMKGEYIFSFLVLLKSLKVTRREDPSEHMLSVGDVLYIVAPLAPLIELSNIVGFALATRELSKVYFVFSFVKSPENFCVHTN